MRRITLSLVATILAVLSTGVVPAWGHEGREVEVGGIRYEFVVGWIIEPAFVEEVNGLSLAVHEHDTEAPVSGLEQTLQVEVSTGGRTATLRFRPVFDKAGAYVADLIPTVIGSYSFRIVGTLNGSAVNEVFECGDATFACVTLKTDLEFPETLPTTRDIWNAVTDLRVSVARITASVDQLVATQQASFVVALASLGAAAVALVLAVVAIRRSGHKQ